MKTPQDTNAYLTFELGKHILGIHVSHIAGILAMQPITSEGKMPEAVKGFISLQDEVLPVLDMHRKAGIPDQPYASNASIVLLEIRRQNHTMKVAALLDQALSVEEIDAQSMQEADGLQKLIYATAAVGEQFIQLINMQELLSREELNAFAKVVE